jgi:hypothetical protein
VKQADRAGAQRVRHDRRQLGAHAVQLLEQRQCSAQDAATTRDAGGGDQCQSADARRLGGGELGGDEAAERVADEIDRSEPRPVEQAAEPRGQLAGTEATEPWQLDEVDAVAVRERLGDRRPPAPGAGQTVHDDDVRPVAHDAELGRASVELELPRFHAPTRRPVRTRC